jgi:hypothetical protein
VYRKKQFIVTNEHFKTFYEAFKVKLYIKSKLTKFRTTHLRSIVQLILACCAKTIIKIKIIVLPWQHWRKQEPAFSVDQFFGFIWRHRRDGVKQNTDIRVSRLFVLCISLAFGGKYMELRIIFSLQHRISINKFEVDPPSYSLHNAVEKPKNY